MYAGEELHAWAKDLHQKTLLLSKNCFTQALNLAGTKLAQPWLYQYMLGKTYYKLEMPVNICLENLCNALQTLDREGAIYPRNVDLTTKYFAKEGIDVSEEHSCVSVCVYEAAVAYGLDTGLITERSLVQCLASVIVSLSKTFSSHYSSSPSHFNGDLALAREFKANTKLVVSHFTVEV